MGLLNAKTTFHRPWKKSWCVLLLWRASTWKISWKAYTCAWPRYLCLLWWHTRRTLLTRLCLAYFLLLSTNCFIIGELNWKTFRVIRLKSAFTTSVSHRNISLRLIWSLWSSASVFSSSTYSTLLHLTYYRLVIHRIDFFWWEISDNIAILEHDFYLIYCWHTWCGSFFSI